MGTARGAARLTLGLAVLALLVLGVLHFGELERFIALLRGIEPQRLLPAVLLQATTYLCTAGVWWAALASMRHRRSLKSLVPLSLAKVFTDQALPSAGLSGAMLLAFGLGRRGLPPKAVSGVLLVALVSYYAAYLIAALAALGFLWRHHRANAALVAAAAIFLAITILVPAGALLLRRWAGRRLPAWLESRHLPLHVLETLAAAPGDVLRNGRLLRSALALQLGVIALDALTFWIMLAALGQSVAFPVAFVAFVVASVTSMIGLVPLGLGTFEVAAVGALHLLGVEVEAALAATLLLRGATFWLPMLPGLWIARREMRRPTPPA
jgi:uncharacterized membrane protein YbhN (UPF0104 family)